MTPSSAAGPGHMIGSALPGERGTSVISAHRDRHFHSLGGLVSSDAFCTETQRGRIVWTISRIRVVAAEAPVLSRNQLADTRVDNVLAHSLSRAGAPGTTDPRCPCDQISARECEEPEGDREPFLTAAPSSSMSKFTSAFAYRFWISRVDDLISEEVAEAIKAQRPVVALESSVLAQGLPIPANGDAARRMTAAVEHAGAVPAIAAVASGKAVFGLDEEELARFLARDGVMKVSARDIPVAMLEGRDGATTVAGTLSLMALSPIRVFATGGIGGVHREPQFDESADLAELARTSRHRRVCGREVHPRSVRHDGTPRVAGRGRASAIARRRCRASSSPTRAIPLSTTVHDADEIARLFAIHRSLGRSQAIVVMQPPPAGACGSKGDDRARARYGARRCEAPRRARWCGDAVSTHGGRASDRGQDAGREPRIARGERGTRR